MTDRLKSLRRIEAVQRQMVKLSEMRIALAEQECREFDADASRLRVYIADEDSLGMGLAKAALKSMAVIERKRGNVERDMVLQKQRLDGLLKREKVASAMADKAAVVQRRADEDRDLTQTIESWLVSRDASLP